MDKVNVSTMKGLVAFLVGIVEDLNLPLKIDFVDRNVLDLYVVARSPFLNQDTVHFLFRVVWQAYDSWSITLLSLANVGLVDKEIIARAPTFEEAWRRSLEVLSKERGKVLNKMFARGGAYAIEVLKTITERLGIEWTLPCPGKEEHHDAER